MEQNEPVFVISVAAQLANMHPQTLRQYDRMGLVVPQRRNGKHRRYSSVDVERLRRIQELSTVGVSLEGVRRMIELEREAAALRDQVMQLQRQVTLWRSQAQAMGPGGVRVFSAGSTGEVSIKKNGREARARQTRSWGMFELTR
ncbi:heat shock protein transcriptional repressor HspR [Galactobacter caseinivorans]|uniref:MerR family transcriptional regulator n=1 Tax=Galactobacter caseinivorans TaxID=2676123 RepID=A0A496PN18_9MICC|nr:MerR family transcriptional regulator [Galactobacter caseinivorans]RKW71928.1 MerR family transcriptional regulator [Galactobacter caseinivorans]